jgi:hypothetical protein
MKTNTNNFNNDQFAILYRQVARTINECLPLGMKDEYSVDLISEILELEDEYLIKMRLLGKATEPAFEQPFYKDMIRAIIDAINSKGIFPTYSDIEQILGTEKVYLLNMGMNFKNVA